MSDKHYKNYFNEYDRDESFMEDSASYLVRKNVLEKYQELTKSINKSIKKHGTKRFKHRLLDKRIPRTYKAAAKEPIDEKKVVFVEVRHPYISNSFEVMFDELINKYDYNIHTHFLLNGSTTRADYSRRAINCIEDIATAKYVFLDEASDALSAMKLRDGTKIIQLWHGCGAFKGFGFSTADLIYGETRKEKLKHPYYKNFSLVTISSPEVTWAYSEAMNIPEESGIIQATGVSRTDIFFNDEYKAAAYEHLYDIVPQAKGKKVIMYAPTFRGRVAKANTPKRLNIEMFYNELGDDYVLLFKHHPLVKRNKRPLIEEQFENFAFDVTDDLSIEDLIITSDVCISDYSSLIFEYSLFEKPLIFFAFDLDTYTDWRGFYYDYDEMTPGPICKTNFEMIDYIKNIGTRFNKQEVIDFKYKFMRSCDGHSTQRILDAMFEDLDKHKKPREKFEHFYDVPKVKSSIMPYHRMVKNIAKEKEAAKEIYAKELKKPIEKGSIVAFDIQSDEIKYVLSKLERDRISVVNPGDNFDDVIRKAAVANYIIIDNVNPLIDSLDIREETKVVFLPPDAFPLNSFGKITKEYRSGLKREQYELAPLFSSVDAFVCSSDETAELYRKAIGEDTKAIVSGDVKSDVFFKTGYKDKALEKLYEVCPQLEGKKIIGFIQDEYSKAFNDSMIYEYLSRDYAFLKLYKNANPALLDEEKLELNYMNDCIIDVSYLLGKFELLAISDIIVGGFDSDIYSAMVTDKPIIVYSGDAAYDILNAETFIDIEENSPSPICTDINEVIEIIRNIDKYNYDKYNELKEKYLKKCNGKSAKRLIEKLI